MNLKKLLVLAGAMALWAVSVRAQNAPTIASISNSQTVTEGQAVSFTTSINGTPPFTYQWQKGGNNIDGATNGSLSFTAVRVSDAGSYTVVVTNAVGSVTGGPILLAVNAATAPVINFGPNSQTLSVGDTLNVSVSVSGTPPFTYDWKRNGVTVATTSTFSKVNVQTADAGTYTLTVTNIAGAATSAAFTVTVNPATAPVISSVSSSRTLNPGDFMSLGVNATGSGSLSYQWNKDGVPIGGATSSNYSRTVSTTDAGTYTVTVSNAVGAVTSTAIVITVVAPVVTAPTISSLSTPITVNVGDSFNLSAFFNGTSPFTYQWRKDGVPISGATSSSYSRASATLADVGSYSVTATNAAGSTTSPSTSVSVNAPQLPIVLRPPTSQLLNPGDSGFISVSVTPFNASYQWRRNGTPIPGATSSSLSFLAPGSGTDTYTVLVSNSQGSVLSEPAVIGTVTPTLPVIFTDPASQAVHQGETFSLQVDASGTLSPTYQWRKDGVAIAGANSAFYNKATTAASDAGAYAVAVTNAAGVTISAVANVTVLPALLPVITRQPASFSLLPGDSSSGLSVNVRPSSAATTYQWRKDGVPIGGATSSNLFISNAQPSIAGAYTVVVTNAAGSVTSAPGIVTVDLARPAITFSPGGIVAAPGDFLSLQIGTNTSATNPVIQWRKDGVVVPNATSASLSLNNFSAANVGTYIATVTPAGGTPVDSRPITVDVLDLGLAPRILRPPLSITRAPGGSASFDLTDEGERPTTYQWRKDGVAIPGATGVGYSISSLVVANAGNYSVVVTNRNGSVTSDGATLTVGAVAATAPPVIRGQPTSVVLTPNNSGSLSVTLVSTTGATYQWLKGGVPIANATSSTFSFQTVAANAGRYSVVVTNSAGSVTSSEALVTIIDLPAAPRFTSQPQSQSVLPGSTVTFSVVAIGSTTPTLQWRKNGTDIPGAITDTLVLSNVQAGDAAIYSVIATTPDGVASSTAANLAILTPTAGVPTITQQPRAGAIFPAGSYTLFAGVAGNPAPTYQWFKGGTAIPGATGPSLTVTSQLGQGLYSLTATNSFGLASSNLVSVTQGNTITFAVLSPSQTVAAGAAVTLSATVQSTSALTYQWRKNGVAIPGATNPSLGIAQAKPSDSGSYTLVATTVDGAVESSPILLNVPSSPFAGVYTGSFGTGDTWSLYVAPEGTATLIGQLSARNQAVIARNFLLQANGAFNIAGDTGSPFAASFYYNGAITGTIVANGGTVTGQLVAAGVSFSGGLKPATGVTTGVAGYYAGVALASALSELHAIAAADGTLTLIAIDNSGVRGGRGQVGASGAFSFVQSQLTITGNVGTGGASLTGTYQLTGGPIVSIAAPATPNGGERLANVSTRSLAGNGARTLIAGFAINGTAPKDVLVRAAGPALAAFGVPGTLANPRLKIYRGATSLFENDDWSVGGAVSQVSSAAARLGAFPFAIGSADAALLVRLDPGSYTAQVTSDTEPSGVALVEVYDASTDGTNQQRLVNLSTRADVGTGGNILIVGVVVSGSAPKKLLVRGIGPTLGVFGVPGALTSPRLQLYRGSQLLRENTGWSSGPDAALIAAAAAQVGAFALADGSNDCALLLYLAPGNYTAQISGVNNTTGVALVEVYEVP